MILPLLGRAEETRALEEASQRARSGQSVVVSIEGSLGSGKSRLLDEWAAQLEQAGFEVRRAAAFSAGETHPGLIARQLALAEQTEATLALLVDDAHWADLTSIALLQRAVALPRPSGLLVALAHRPVTGARAVALDQLGGAAGRKGGYVSLVLDPLTASDLDEVVDDDALRERLVVTSRGLPYELERSIQGWIEAGHATMVDGRLVVPQPPPVGVGPAPLSSRVPELPRQGRKLVEATALAGQPLSVPLAAELLQSPPDDVLELGERLSEDGYLRQAPEGFVPTNSLTAEEIAEGMGAVRRAALYGELADAMTRAGLRGQDPGVTGSYLLRASRFIDALPLLAEAGLAAVRHQALGEALPLIEGAMAALERSDAPRDDALNGKLRLARAQCYHRAGWDDLAAEDLEVATRELSGPEQVHALGWAASVADDRQRVQEAERFAALAELEAIRNGEPAMLGSLLTLHARVLSRLGFAGEADATLVKGNSLLEMHGSSLQRYRGRHASARIAFDEGRVRDAEGALAELVAEAPRLGGAALAADSEAWWARALVQSGHPDGGLEVRREALAHADQSASAGPTFLAHMALSEGAEAHGQYEQALAAADEALSLALQMLPDWENAARYLRARALLGLGRLDEAAGDIDRAVELCPPGIDGWRWRLRCRVFQMRIAGARDEPLPSAEAVEVTDQLLQARWYQAAVELMTLRAGREDDRELARDAAALAVQLGSPMAAAEAAHAGRLWEDPDGQAVVAMVKTLDRRVPDGWRERWRDLPWVAPALAAPELTEEAYREASGRLFARLNAALAQAGLGDPERLLSPAQRRAAGLVRPRRRRRFPVPVVATAAAAVVVLGVLGGLIGSRLVGGRGDGDGTQAGSRTLEETRLPAPDGQITGSWNVGGDLETYASRSGVSARSGVPKATGHYWTYDTDVPVQSSPAIYGQLVLVGIGNDLHAIDATTGDQIWVATTQGAIDGPPTVGLLATGETGSRAVVFFGSRDGFLYARDVLRGAPAMPPFRTGGQVVSSPLVVDGVVFIGATDGKLYALDATTGTERWPAFVTGAEIRASPSYADGTLYVASMDGRLYAIDAATGTQRCATSGAIGPLSATPVVVGDTVLVGSSAQDLWEFGATDCRLSSTGTYRTGTPVEVAPAVSDGIVYIPSDRRVLAIELGTNQDVWVFDGAQEAIRSSPVVASGVMYVGSDDGRMYAVDLLTGEELWKWETDGRIRSSPAIADGAIFFGSFDGLLYAVGGTG